MSQLLVFLALLCGVWSLERPCSSNICLNGGTCKVDDRSYRCYCEPGFSGSLCQDICTKKCANGVCVKGKTGTEECKCNDGWSGLLCEVSGTTVEGCIHSEDCPDGKVCIQNDRGLRVCLTDPCESNPCHNNATCTAENGDYRCECPLGYGGKHCDTDVNECELSPCKNGGTCINLDGSFECLCNERFKGFLCADVNSPCLPNPCQQHATCIEMVDDFHCLCPASFTGKSCEVKVDSSVSNPENPCASNPCANEGKCNQTEDGYECLCRPEFSGKNCESISECTVDGQQCSNGGICVRGLGKSYCKCSSGFSGVFCETSESDSSMVAPNDPCIEKPCENGGTCSISAGTATCACTPGFQGPLCQTPQVVNACQPNPCNNDGLCESVGDPAEGGYQCICTNGFEGNLCEIKSIKHTESPVQEEIQTTTPYNVVPTIQPHKAIFACEQCSNMEKCIDTEEGSICVCRSGFSGVTCENQGEICDNNKCVQPQICKKKVRVADSEVHCGCPLGFGGTQCDKQTVVSFNEESLFLYHTPNIKIGSSSGPLPYMISITFRTTVPDVHLVSGENIFGQNLFKLSLVQGKLALNMSGTAVYNALLPVTLNDGYWYTAELSKTQKDFQINILEENGYEILSKSLPRLSSFEVFSTRIGKISEHQSFTGCIADLTIDSILVDIAASDKARNIQTGCNRVSQCQETKCLNEGTCVDLWSKSKCECKPPFLPPLCAVSIPPSTFGYNNLSSFAEISIPQEVSDSLQFSTDIQFLLRSNKPSGAILYIGEANGDDVGTFTSIEVMNDTISVRTRAGSKTITTVNGRRPVTDNEEHFIRVERTQRHVKLYVDGIFESEGDIASRFNHPMFNEKLIIGSPENTTSNAFTSTNYFKGSLQDIRVNGMSALLSSNSNEDIDGIGVVSRRENVQEGLISDDVCSQRQPCIRGTCHNTFNDFECICQKGYFGKNCEQKDYCLTSPCPSGGTCQNVIGGFSCVSPVSLVTSSMMTYNLNLTNPEDLSFIELSIRTHSDNGRIFTLNSESGNVVMSIVNKQLVITTNSPFNTRKTIADGTWKDIRLQGNILKINNASSGVPSTIMLPAPLSKAHLTLGSVGQFKSFTGCLNNVRFGNLPSLSFYREEDQQLPKNLRYWKNSQRKRIVTTCMSSPQCGKMSTCLNGAECRDEWNSFKCICPFGFTGKRCEININECEKADCGNGHCIDGLGDYRCQCDEGYTGLTCDTQLDMCSSNPCENRASCSDLGNGTFHCECSDGWTGQLCNLKEPSSCEGTPCQNGGTCTMRENSVECSCPPGTSGDYCEVAHDPCAKRPCQNGICQKTRSGFTCICEEGFAGQSCSEVADICSTDSCSLHGRCVAAWNNTMCNCDQGWTGRKCSEHLNVCMDIPCENDGECTSAGGFFKCKCPQYYLGDRCEVEGTCLSSPCEFGKCVQLKYDDHVCQCDKGYEGATCATRIDYCKTSPCLNGATCESLIGEYKCHCIPGFNGTNCQQDIDECSYGYCSNGSVCRDRVNDYECICEGTGFTGKNCTEDIDECALSTSCIHGACSNMKGSYKCDCEQGFIGKRCSMKDPCLKDEFNRTHHSCVHGTCVNGIVRLEHGHEVTDHECKCFRGYGGPQCTTKVEERRIVALSYILGPVIAMLLVFALLGCILFCFVWKGKRALHGHYSPSHQEMNGARMQMNSMIKLPPEERLI